MEAKFINQDLKIYSPDFDSSLTGLIVELEVLRNKTLIGSTSPAIFFQLKYIFQILESIGSARIEGNRTTLAEFIETKIERNNISDEKIIEIQNVEKALDFIDGSVKENSIDRLFISEIHKIIVQGLKKEGSEYPGEYRRKNILISGSLHKPPEFLQIGSYMDELFEFIKKDTLPKYDLLKTAISHHRFVWIHPFDNGNGRVVRLLTYAMLVKQGFNVHENRILNSTAIFCNNREKYYESLSWADSGSKDDTLKWCEYMLSGLKKEIEKIDKLLDYGYLVKNILLPALEIAYNGKFINDEEYSILKISIQKQIFQASDLKKILPSRIPSDISRRIKRMIDKKLIASEGDKSRKYHISFNNNFLIRSIIKTLRDNDFVPITE
jgi:Fic family protein